MEAVKHLILNQNQLTSLGFQINFRIQEENIHYEKNIPYLTAYFRFSF